MNLTNFYDHPQDNRYLVFKFFDENVRDAFELTLNDKGIYFERDDDVNEAGNAVTYFGVSKTYKDEAIKANYEAFGQFRKPMIPNPILRYGFLIFVFVVVVIAIVGAILTGV